jgi:hypothetical protein
MFVDQFVGARCKMLAFLLRRCLSRVEIRKGRTEPIASGRKPEAGDQSFVARIFSPEANGSGD